MKRGIQVGDPAYLAFISIILSHHGIASLQISRYTPPLCLQKRLSLTECERDLVERALRIHGSNTTSFWHAIFSASLESKSCPHRIIDEALFHSGPGLTETISISELPEIDWNVLAGGNQNVGISSCLLHTDGSISHLSVLDFHCGVSGPNTDIVESACSRLFRGGYVLIDSGNSYHAVGMDLQTPSERISFLGRAVLLGPIVDVSYVGHQLQQAFSTIRISRGGKRNRLPTVLAIGLNNCGK